MIPFPQVTPCLSGTSLQQVERVEHACNQHQRQRQLPSDKCSAAFESAVHSVAIKNDRYK